jgi:hypothetical protein
MSLHPAAVESVTAADGNPEAGATAAEWAAWAIRKMLPSELAHKPALRWPGDVGELFGIPDATLKALRTAGDHPRLYAIGRALYTTRRDADEWLQAHALAPGQGVRPPTIPRGARRPVRVTAGSLSNTRSGA